MWAIWGLNWPWKLRNLGVKVYWQLIEGLLTSLLEGTYWTEGATLWFICYCCYYWSYWWDASIPDYIMGYYCYPGLLVAIAIEGRGVGRDPFLGMWIRFTWRSKSPTRPPAGNGTTSLNYVVYGERWYCATYFDRFNFWLPIVWTLPPTPSLWTEIQTSFSAHCRPAYCAIGALFFFWSLGREPLNWLVVFMISP